MKRHMHYSKTATSEDEGGVILSDEQTTRANVYFEESWRIEKILQAIGNQVSIKSLAVTGNDNNHCMT